MNNYILKKWCLNFQECKNSNVEKVDNLVN